MSALLSPTGAPATIYNAWEDGGFTLLTCGEQLDELRAVLGKPKIAELIKPHRAGRLVNQMRRLAEHVDRFPASSAQPDPMDDFRLALCEAGRSDYPVAGGKSGLLAFVQYSAARSITAKKFAVLIA